MRWNIDKFLLVLTLTIRLEMASKAKMHPMPPKAGLDLGSVVQAAQSSSGYGLVLALQVSLPCTRLTLVQSLSAEYPDHPRQMFRLEVSDIQTAVALEDGEQDIR